MPLDQLLRRQARCKFCQSVFRPHGQNPGSFCSNKCKAEWQRTQKPVDFDWLYEKYIVEEKSAAMIAVIVCRDAKRVWQWLRDYGIPTRSRGTDPASKKAGFQKGHKLGVGRKVSEETRIKMSAIAKAQGRVPFDPKIGPPFRGKRGAEIPSWRGGVTPERQKFYASIEWKAAVKAVWKRDNATCRKCGLKNKPGQRFAFDIHHIVSFECRELRAEVDNLVLLCEKCHYWVHSNENVDSLFIKETASVVA